MCIEDISVMTNILRLFIVNKLYNLHLKKIHLRYLYISSL